MAQAYSTLVVLVKSFLNFFSTYFWETEISYTSTDKHTVLFDIRWICWYVHIFYDIHLLYVRYSHTTLDGTNVFVRQLSVFQKMALLEDNLNNQNEPSASTHSKHHSTMLNSNKFLSFSIVNL